MERLIVEYSEGDAYTYSCTVTLPIIYESKAKAVSDLETLLLQHQIDLEEKSKKYEQHEPVLEKARSRYLTLKAKKNKEKEAQEAYEELSKVMAVNGEISASVKDGFKFGGQDFYYSNFVSRDRDGGLFIYPPEIYTVDEFFAKIELY